MKFGVMAFSAGIFVQFGGVDAMRLLRVRIQVGYVWHGVYRHLWSRVAKNPDMMLYDKA